MSQENSVFNVLRAVVSVVPTLFVNSVTTILPKTLRNVSALVNLST